MSVRTVEGVDVRCAGDDVRVEVVWWGEGVWAHLVGEPQQKTQKLEEVAREEVEVGLCCLRNLFGMVERQEVGEVGDNYHLRWEGHWEDGEWEYCPQQTRGWSLSLQDH